MDEMVAARIRSKPEKVPTAIIDSSLSSACHGIPAFYDQKKCVIAIRLTP